VIQKLPRWLFDLILSFLSALLLGAVFSGISAGGFLQGWLAFAVLFWACLFALLRIWRTFGAARSLAVLLSVAFFIRLAVAVLVSVGLPIWGYENPVNNAGFLYSDAYDRDQAAFKLAADDKPLLTAFTAPDKTDQYGGLLFISAATYGWLSPDADRPLLISLLAAFCMAAGIGFFWAAVQKRWPLKVAFLAAWILALFPDSVMLGSAQMREPFLIGLACIAFWAVLSWHQTPLKSAVIALLTLAVCCAFSVPAGGVFAAILAAVIVLEWSVYQKRSSLKWLGFTALAMVSLVALAGGWLWLRSTLYYDSFTTMMQSGWVQALMRQYGQRWMIPFTSIYGLTQPVLPAAFTDPADFFWKTVAILRALGWYTALPFLFYSLFAAFKAKTSESKWLLVLFNWVFLIWVFVASARAGGDQWDNPRYRYILLPFMCLLIAWGYQNYRQTHSPWFWRWVAVVGEFLLFFMNFYLNRMMNTGTKISFPLTIALVIVAALGILAGGYVWDRTRTRIKKAA
jgi:hypothetical protein